MSPENTKRLHELVVKRGTEIHNKLPSHTSHPDGRIGIAHIYSVIKAVMGCPMKECRDIRYDEIVEIINYTADNVHVIEGLTAPLKAKIHKEPLIVPATLDKFF